MTDPTQLHVIPYRGFTITLVFDKSSRVWSGTSGDISVDACSTSEGEELFKAAVDNYLKFCLDYDVAVGGESVYASSRLSNDRTYGSNIAYTGIANSSYWAPPEDWVSYDINNSTTVS